MNVQEWPYSVGALPVWDGVMLKNLNGSVPTAWPRRHLIGSDVHQRHQCCQHCSSHDCLQGITKVLYVQYWSPRYLHYQINVHVALDGSTRAQS